MPPSNTYEWEQPELTKSKDDPLKSGAGEILTLSFRNHQIFPNFSERWQVSWRIKHVSLTVPQSLNHGSMYHIQFFRFAWHNISPSRSSRTIVLDFRPSEQAPNIYRIRWVYTIGLKETRLHVFDEARGPAISMFCQWDRFHLLMNPFLNLTQPLGPI